MLTVDKENLPHLTKINDKGESNNVTCKAQICTSHEGMHCKQIQLLMTPNKERFEPETSNLVCRLTTGGTNDKKEKLGQRGSGRGHVPYF